MYQRSTLSLDTCLVIIRKYSFGSSCTPTSRFSNDNEPFEELRETSLTSFAPSAHFTETSLQGTKRELTNAFATTTPSPSSSTQSIFVQEIGPLQETLPFSNRLKCG